MKDSWRLLEDSLMGNRESFIDLMQEATPAILVYFYTVYGGNTIIALAETQIALEKTFVQLKNRSQSKSFLEWILFDLYAFKKEKLISELKEETNLNKFTALYFKEICNCRFTFEFIQPSSFLKEELDKAKAIVEASNKIQANELANCIKEIRDRYRASNRVIYYLHKNFFSFAIVLVSLALMIYSIYNWQERFPKSKKVDFSKLNLIQPPLAVIFEDIYNKESTWEDEFPDTTQENKKEEVEITKPDEIKNTTFELKVETVEPEVPKQEIVETKIEIPKEIIPKEIKEENIPPPVETVKELPLSEKVEPKTEPVLPEETKEPIEPEIEQEIVVLNKKEIPLVPKDLKKMDDGAIQLGDDKEKYDLKDFKDKKVVFYSFLVVKDVEKAKDEAFKILAKFKYKGEVLKREKDYIVLTATFPGKENHDRMIKKFNGLGTLYVGNDVSEFLELYKSELDKERSFFFPKYKPEDLPKEVTVNLYVFPKQKK